MSVAGTLSDVLRGAVPAHGNGDRPSVYAPVGLPWQDVALTWLLYQRTATANLTIIDLLA